MTDTSKEESAKSKTLSAPDPSGKSRDVLMAELVLNGIMNSAVLAVDFSKDNYGDLSLTECAMVLGKKARDIHKGDLKNIETLLIGQALALDAVFASLARRAQLNMGEYVNVAERYMRLALKAQGQCRATLETLSAIKNPPVVIARQANVAHGPQQVNNGVQVKPDANFDNNTRERTHAGNSDSVQNKLLEDRHDEWLDTRTPGTTGRGNPAMATVGAINRPPHD